MKTMLNKIFRSVAVFCLLLLTAAYASAQSRTTVTGVIKDTKGQTVVGAVVMLDGNSSVATVTGIDGKYTLNVPADKLENAKINVSCMGYTTQVEALGKRTVLDFELEEDSELLDEVVVVGYGSMRKSDLTGSVASVKISEEEQDRTTSLDQMLMGRAAGVDVIMASENPDAGVSVRIRGVTSLVGSSEPLYVVDGVILTEPTSHSLSSDELEDVNHLMGINPQDIASIEVLKDASATAIYGASGANGVVLITTKQANKERPTIQFNAGLDISTTYKYIDVLDIDQFIDFAHARIDAGDTSNYPTVMLNRIFNHYKIDDTRREDLVVKNWQAEYLKPAPRQRYYLSISGRPKTLAYTLSLGYNSTKGVVPNTSNEQFTARMNLDKTFFKKLKIGTKINFAYIHSRTMQGAGSSSNGVSNSFTKSLVAYRPLINVALSDIDEEEEETDDDVTKGSPTKWINGAYQSRDQIRVTPTFYAEYSFKPWLSLRSAFGGDYHLQERTNYKSPQITKGNPSAGLSYSEAYSWNWDTTLNLNRKFGKHYVNGTVGYTMSKKCNNVESIVSSNIVQDGNGMFNIDSSFQHTMDFNETETSKMSVFARAVYNYNDRYVLTATYRLDGSSVFEGRRRFSGFPSFAFAWRLNQEPWFNVRAISMAKIRIGWGLVGNCSVSPYQTMVSWGSKTIGYHFNDGQYKLGLATTTFSNSDLKWETTEQLNVGLDFGMWKGRLSLSADAYIKHTYDLLNSRTIAATSGYTSMYVNQGSIENKGFEFTLDATPVIKGDFEWNISGNFSLNRNKLTDLGYDVEQKDFYFEPGVKTQQTFYTGGTIATSSYLRSAPINVFMLGQPIGLLYGYRTAGLVKEGEFGVPSSQAAFEANDYQQPGMVNYVDMNGNGYIDVDDRTIIGDSNPDFSYGFSTSFSYKKLRLNVVFQGVFGRDIYNANNMKLSDTHLKGNLGNIYPDALYNAWTPARPYTEYVMLQEGYYRDLTGESFYHVYDESYKKDITYATDRDVQDGSYLRISSLGLSYTFDLPKNAPVKRIGIGASVNNLAIWTNYNGFSPMVESYKITSKRMGIDSGGSPASRTFCFDLKFTF